MLVYSVLLVQAAKHHGISCARFVSSRRDSQLHLVVTLTRWHFLQILVWPPQTHVLGSCTERQRLHRGRG